MTPVHTLYFGKHKGKPLAEIPTGYLHWLAREVKLSTGLAGAVRDELGKRGAVVPSAPPARPHACPRGCNAGLVVTWLHQRDGRRVIRSECAKCGTSAGILPNTAENVARADAGTNKGALLAFLMALEDAGIEVERVNGYLRFTSAARMTREMWNLERQCRGLLLSLLIETGRVGVKP